LVMRAARAASCRSSAQARWRRPCCPRRARHTGAQLIHGAARSTLFSSGRLSTSCTSCLPSRGRDSRASSRLRWFGDCAGFDAQRSREKRQLKCETDKLLSCADAGQLDQPGRLVAVQPRERRCDWHSSSSITLSCTGRHPTCPPSTSNFHRWACLYERSV